MKKNLVKITVAMLIIGLMATTAAIAEDQSVTGTVEQTDNGIVIADGSGATYIVEGKDLSDMVGKMVKATGTLSEGAAGKTLTVISVEEIK